MYFPRYWLELHAIPTKENTAVLSTNAHTHTHTHTQTLLCNACWWSGLRIALRPSVCLSNRLFRLGLCLKNGMLYEVQILVEITVVRLQFSVRKVTTQRHQTSLSSCIKADMTCGLYRPSITSQNTAVFWLSVHTCRWVIRTSQMFSQQ